MAFSGVYSKSRWIIVIIIILVGLNLISGFPTGCNTSTSEFSEPLVQAIGDYEQQLLIVDNRLLIPSNINKLTINCTFHRPIFWGVRRNALPSYVSSTESIRQFTEYGNWTPECYSINLVFSNITEDITGIYKCSIVDDTDYEGIEFQLFSGQRSLEQPGFILRRRRTSTSLQPRGNYGMFMSCMVNNPHTKLAFYFSPDFHSSDTEWILIPETLINFHPVKGTSIRRIAVNESLTTFFLNCTTNVSGDSYVVHYVERVVRLDPKPGKTEILALSISSNEEFVCEAPFAINMTVVKSIPDVNYDISYAKNGFKGTVKISYLGREVPSREVGSVQCAGSNQIIHTWKHKLFDDHDLRATSSKLSFHAKTRKATCVTIGPDDAEFKFITTRTAEDNQFKSECLRRTENITCTDENLLSGFESSINSISVQLPAVSGKLTCLGLDVSFGFSYFLNTDEKTISDIPFNEDVVYAENVSHQITCSTRTPQVSEFMNCKCLFSRRLFASPIILSETKSDGTIHYIDFEDVPVKLTKFQEISFHYKLFKVQISSLNIQTISCMGFLPKSPQFYYANWTITPTKFVASTVEGRSMMVIVSSIGVTAFLILVVLGWILRNKIKRKNSYKNALSINEINNFLHGNPNLVGDNGYENAQRMPFAGTEYQLDMSCLKIKHESILGSGAYGVVLKGEVYGTNAQEVLEVAVKMVKPDADTDYLKALLGELKVMTYIGKNKHICELIGAITNKLDESQLYVVLRLYPNGSLCDYLKSHRKYFQGTKEFHQPKLLKEPRDYTNKLAERKTISIKDLVQWSCDIAAGMDFLASIKVIHGDLATRNVLLDEHRQVKISDFGLARQLYNYSLYQKKSQVPLPWRWLSIEALCDMSFSMKSDIWAYGVTVWEIFTLGEIPYPGLTYDGDFIKLLKSGYRLEKPDLACQEIYDAAMFPTWSCEPDERPNFSDLVNDLENLLQNEGNLGMPVENKPAKYAGYANV